MRVVINQQAALGRRTGIGHYTAELLRCLRRQTPPGTISVFPGRFLHRVRTAWDWLMRRLARSGSGGGGAPRVFGGRGWVRAAFTRYFQVLSRLRGAELYHEPNFLPIPTDLPTITTLHDLSVVLHPEWHPADRIAHFEKHLASGLRQSVHFLAISDYARRELIDTLGIAPERITRTYMGIRPGLGPLPEERIRPVLQRLKLPPRYLLYLGTIEPRKNVLRLLRAYCSLPGEVRERWPLLLVGGWGWNAGDVAAYLNDEARHRGVMHLGYVADDDVPALYNGTGAGLSIAVRRIRAAARGDVSLRRRRAGLDSRGRRGNGRRASTPHRGGG